jgi:predicted DNA-binding ribbon-helix-helix protein
MKSLVMKRSIVIHGHKTSVSLEDSFWRAMKGIATAAGTTLSDLVGSIADSRGEGGNLSSAIRVHVLAHFRDKAAALAGTGEKSNVVPLQSTETPAAPERRPVSAFARPR